MFNITIAKSVKAHAKMDVKVAVVATAVFFEHYKTKCVNDTIQ